MSAQNYGKPESKRPISAHPAFPAIVALWFAALLGLGSLVLPIILFEKLVVATGLASVLSAAEPPLGVNFRILVAAFATLLGMAIGLFLARKVASAQAPVKVRKRPATLASADSLSEPSTKRPISAHEELGSDYLDDPVDGSDEGSIEELAQERAPKRRALAVTDDSGPSEYFGEIFGSTPFPEPENAMEQTMSEQPDDLGQTESELHQSGLQSAPAQDDALDLGDFVQESGEEPAEPLIRSREFALQKQQFGTGTLSSNRMPHKSSDQGFLAAKFEPEEHASVRPFDMPQENPNAADNARGASAAPFAAQAEEARPFASPGAIAAVSAALSDPLAALDVDEEQDEQPVPRFGMPQAIAADTDNVTDQAMKFEPEQMPESVAETFSDTVPEPAAEPLPELARAFAEPSEETSAIETASPIAGLAELSMSELLERFSRSLQDHASTSNISAIETSSPVGAELPAEPAVERAANFQSSAHAVSTAAESPSGLDGHIHHEVAAAATGTTTPEPVAASIDSVIENPSPQPELSAKPSMPAALRPVGVDEFDDASDADDDGFSGDFGSLSHSLSASSSKPFSQPEDADSDLQHYDAANASFSDALGDEADEEDLDEGYSSLLAMKQPIGPGREFVRVDEDAEQGENNFDDTPEPVVVFPGQEGRQAAPAADGPSRGPQTSVAAQAIARPFAAPAGIRPAPQAIPQAILQSGAAVDASNEAALRDALEKLQRMSNTG